jgi:hypothetical protein
MNTRLIATASLSFVAGLVCLPSHGQQYGNLPTARIEAEPGSGRVMRVYASGSAAQSEIGRIMGELREATDDAKKAELTKKLEAAVTRSFDEDQKAREAELTKLEERLKKLKDQLDRRRKAKSDIIQLQLKVLTNEAEGLGFSRTPGADDLKADPTILLPRTLPPGR